MTKLHLHRSGLVRAATKRSAHRKKRPRRPMAGMMLHQDASTHAWLPSDTGKYDLVVTMDDATSAIYSMFLVDEEGTASSLRGVREVVAKHGRSTRLVDERRDCRDIVPACVPSTVWGTASMRNRQVVLGAVLAPQGRNATPPLVTASGRARPAASSLPTTSRHLSSNRRHASPPALPGGQYHPTNSGTPRQIYAGPCSHRHQPVKQHADRRQVLLDRRLRHRIL